MTREEIDARTPRPKATRQLIYTAITRAKVGVVIVGDKTGIERAVRETKDARRNTALVERLRAA